MKILLNKIKINHFKGIKSLETKFTHNTNIYGDNATGKTTVMDAFLWLLFGKDSTDRTASISFHRRIIMAWRHVRCSPEGESFIYREKFVVI